ncbi:3-oxoacyl-[acyl-carrier protein] reductase [Caballeronia sordidicola]|uniref:3-oxoacyl-[acyl-carrier protein] reductase n=1 Tax=Caballeronia sordidicola TaxID=196367 RepID=A0A242MBV8_CABSO|nr:3-oxoacyl-[acyl-carrier protein] reductase [Caballeronia sordidicola]
MSLSISLDGR